MAALRALCLLALIGAAAAFTAPSMGGLKLRSNKAAMTMKAENSMPKAAQKALAPAIALANIAVASPVFAEGTGESLGVDDGRLIVPLVLIPVVIGLLWGGFASDQDNSDFFDTYDQRRK